MLNIYVFGVDLIYTHFGIYIFSRQNDQGPIPDSLIFHRKISNTMRILTPLAIVATIVIFIVSNLSIGASVDIQVNGPDGSSIVKFPTVTDFSLGKTVGQMYDARVYSLMMLVLVFSGIWPYVKLIMMLVSWISPVSIISFEHRERLLIWLDALGKYSLVDSFVLVLMLVSFKFRLDFPGVGSIDSYVIPACGFYLFLIGTVLSLVIGHGVTFLHRFTKLPKIQHSSLRESLCHHAFQVENANDTNDSPQFVKLSRAAHVAWAAITLFCITLLSIGAMNKSFTFEFQGLTGVILGDDRRTSYSLITLGTSLPLSVEDPSSIGITCIQYTFFFFAFLMPLACLCNITILYYVPMTLRSQQIVFMLAEITNAWSAVEVFLLSVMASMFELSRFAEFMVGDLCDFMKAQFFQDLFNGEDTCFSVKSTVGFGVIYLCIGVAMHNFVVFTGLRLAHHALEERMLREEDGEENLTSKHDSTIAKAVRWKMTRFLVESTDGHEM